MTRPMRSQEEVTLNLASMLDMAFQLLAFFILTFQTLPKDPDVLAAMGPAGAVVPTGLNDPGLNDPGLNDPGLAERGGGVKALTTLTISLIARGQNGQLAAIEIGVPGRHMETVDSIGQLRAKLAEYLGGAGAGFEQVVVQSTPTVPWETLMQVIDICNDQPSLCKVDKENKVITKLRLLQLAAN